MYIPENEQVYHPDFAQYVERNLSADINPNSYHSTAFEVTNPLLYIYFPSFGCNFF